MRATKTRTGPPAGTGGPLARVGPPWKAPSDANREELMPCHVRSASLPRNRSRPSLPLSPPRIVAKLNMQNEVERDTQAFLTRACSGRWPMWRLLGMKRHRGTLFISVEWPCCVDARYSLVALSLERIALRWWYFPTADAARAALAALEARHSPPHTPTVPSAPMAG